jgi:hypothetical protein
MAVCVLDSTTYGRTPKGRPLPPEPNQKFLDLETLLAMALDAYAPLIVLGRPGEQVGAGRILTSEDAWQDDFHTLSSKALVIRLLPSTQPGTTWEMQTILKDASLLSKTVFLIPASERVAVAPKGTIYGLAATIARRYSARPAPCTRMPWMHLPRSSPRRPAKRSQYSPAKICAGAA